MTTPVTARGAAFRNDDTIGAGGIGRAKNGAQVVWIFHAVEHDDERMSAALGGDHVVKAVVLFGGRDRHHALVSSVAGHAVEFGALQKAHRHAQPRHSSITRCRRRVMALLGHVPPIAKARPRAFSASTTALNAVDVVHSRKWLSAYLHWACIRETLRRQRVPRTSRELIQC